jgi:hypothetical protein
MSGIEEKKDEEKSEEEMISDIMGVADALANNQKLWWVACCPFKYDKKMNAPFMHRLLVEVHKKGYYLAHDTDTFHIWVRGVLLRRSIAYNSPVVYLAGLAWFTYHLANYSVMDPLLFWTIGMWFVVITHEFAQTVTTTPRAMSVFTYGIMILNLAVLGGACCWRIYHV